MEHDRGRGDRAYIVPKRAFQNEKLTDEFFQFVVKMLENKKERQ